MANEKRLIDANALELELERTKRISKTHNMSFTVNHVVSCIKNAPAVDAVEVVRCKDCKYYEIHKPKVLENCERKGYMIPMLPDDFCSYGERREGE